MAEDPAVTRAKQLWQQKQPKEAMQVLMRRIGELKTTSHAYRVRWITTGCCLGMILAVILAVPATWLMVSRDDESAAAARLPVAMTFGPSTAIPGFDSEVTEWWSYNAGMVYDYLSAISRALAMMERERTDNGPDNLFATWPMYMDGADDLQQQFEAAPYPFAAKAMRDSILAGMIYFNMAVYGADEDFDLFLTTGKFSPETEGYLNEARKNMRFAVQEIKRLTGEDAGFLTLESQGDAAALLTPTPDFGLTLTALSNMEGATQTAIAENLVAATAVP